MPMFDPITTPAGYVVNVHTMPAHPRKSSHPTVDGGALHTQHGYEQERIIYGRFCAKTEIEPIIALWEVDGFSREGQPNITQEISEAVALYRFECRLKRRTATDPGF